MLVCQVLCRAQQVLSGDAKSSSKKFGVDDLHILLCLLVIARIQRLVCVWVETFFLKWLLFMGWADQEDK